MFSFKICKFVALDEVYLFIIKKVIHASQFLIELYEIY